MGGADELTFTVGWFGRRDVSVRRTVGVVVRMSTLDTKVDGSIPSINMFSP